MSDLKINDVIAGLTAAQVKSKIYDIMVQLGVSTTNWKPGAALRLVIAACAIILSKLSQLVALLARMSFLDTSLGKALTLVAKWTFGTPRNLATSAAGTVVFVNSEGGSFDYQPYECTVANTVTGKTYRNTQAFSIATGYPTPSTTAPINFAADEVGTASNATPGQISEIVTTMNGVTCSNQYAFVANDDEDDGALIARAQTKPQSRSPAGPRAAYYWFALQATRADGSNVGVNRVTVSPYSTTGVVTVRVASPAGAVSGSASNPATDLGCVYQSLSRFALPEGITLLLETVSIVPLDVTFWAYFPTGTTVSPEAQEAVAQAAIATWLSSATTPIGGWTIPGVITNAIPRDTLRDILSDAFVEAGYPRPTLVRIISPITDVPLLANQVAEPGNIVAQAS